LKLFRKVEETLISEYGPQVLNVCSTATFDHRLGVKREEPSTSIDCYKLAELGYLKGATTAA
jgi:hypothetical protein